MPSSVSASSAHSNSAPNSFDEKVNVAVMSGVSSGGLACSCVTGAVVSGMISQLAEAAGFSVLPSRSVARTRKVWTPIARSAYSYGDVHSANGSLSSEHSKVAPASETKLMMPSMPSTYSTWPDGASMISRDRGRACRG